MRAEDTSFLNLLGGGSREFVIPVFQRQYSWTETQSSQLLGDVVRVARRPRGATHFVGSVVYVASGDHSAVLPQWLVIDGQQRLTTCTILLAVLRNRLKLREGEVPITDSPAALDEQFLLNKFAPPALRAWLGLSMKGQALGLSMSSVPTELPAAPMAVPAAAAVPAAG